MLTRFFWAALLASPLAVLLVLVATEAADGYECQTYVETCETPSVGPEDSAPPTTAPEVPTPETPPDGPDDWPLTGADIIGFSIFGVALVILGFLTLGINAKQRRRKVKEFVTERRFWWR